MRQNEQTEAWLHIHPILTLLVLILVLVLALPLSLSLSPSPALQFTLLPMAREQVKPTEHLPRESGSSKGESSSSEGESDSSKQETSPNDEVSNLDRYLALIFSVSRCNVLLKSANPQSLAHLALPMKNVHHQANLALPMRNSCRQVNLALPMKALSLPLLLLA